MLLLLFVGCSVGLLLVDAVRDVLSVSLFTLVDGVSIERVYA
jgi:hypothetical protein